MAVTTFTTTGAEDTALVVAFGTYLNLGRNATVAEIKAATAAWWQTIVRDQQRIAATQAAAITPIAPT